MDPHGYAVPLGSHTRRMNPRDTAHNMNRRRMIRRGATYGPHLPESAAEDGVERGRVQFNHLVDYIARSGIVNRSVDDWQCRERMEALKMRWVRRHDQ